MLVALVALVARECAGRVPLLLFALRLSVEESSLPWRSVTHLRFRCSREVDPPAEGTSLTWDLHTPQHSVGHHCVWPRRGN